ncbi:MAG: NUDIX hydrolase [Kiritimatiellaeota bacterium]|nr:NUDIX hydrolase [Kiritimatiellota bacterium]
MATPRGKVLGAGRYLRLLDWNGWEYVERHGVRGIVAIVAVTDDRRLLLVEQYRAALDAPVIELPAGLVGDLPGAEQEDLAAAARRELLEETGYAAAALDLLFDGPLASGLCSTLMTYFRARGLRKVHAGGGDELEDIIVHEVPLAAADGWLAAQRARGCLVDPRLYVGLHLAAAWS